MTELFCGPALHQDWVRQAMASALWISQLAAIVPSQISVHCSRCALMQLTESGNVHSMFGLELRC